LLDVSNAITHKRLQSHFVCDEIRVNLCINYAPHLQKAMKENNFTKEAFCLKRNIMNLRIFICKFHNRYLQVLAFSWQFISWNDYRNRIRKFHSNFVSNFFTTRAKIGSIGESQFHDEDLSERSNCNHTRHKPSPIFAKWHANDCQRILDARNTCGEIGAERRIDRTIGIDFSYRRDRIPRIYRRRRRGVETGTVMSQLFCRHRCRWYEIGRSMDR